MSQEQELDTNEATAGGLNNVVESGGSEVTTVNINLHFYSPFSMMFWPWSFSIPTRKPQ